MKRAAGAVNPTTPHRSTNSTASVSSTTTRSGLRERYFCVFMFVWCKLIHNMLFPNDLWWPGGVKLSSVIPPVSQIAEYRKNRRDPPSDLIQQHKEVIHRLQWQKAQLERASPALLTGNAHTHTHIHTVCISLTCVSICLNLWSKWPTFPLTTCVEYENVLRRFVQGLSESVKKYSSQGNRVSAGSQLTLIWM